MSDTISRQAAIDALWKALYDYEDKTEKQFQESDELDVADWFLHRIFVQNMSDIDRKTILNLPSAQPEFAKDKNVPSKSALDHIHNVVKDDAYKRGYEQGKADAAPAVSVNSNTFMIDVSEEDFDKINRVIVGCGPMCRTFYEEGGEAHWIKSYTPDDGEVYECDNCGVAWAFNDGGPEENEAFYCPKCGFKMAPKGEQHETD